ncbi:MAG: DUF1064 domain-containing protein [Oscillospiraceae bacterium]|jgi:hypothetical protein
MRPFRNFRSNKKYGNKSCSCNQGHLHDSHGEAGYCNELALMQKAGEIKGYEIQRTFDLNVNGKKVCGHRVDFLVTNKEGKEEVHEFKGFATAEWNIKRKLFEAIYPEIEYIVIRK